MDTKVLNASFLIVEVMDELDGYREILDCEGNPTDHPYACDLMVGIKQILSDFETEEQEQIIFMVNDQRGMEEKEVTTDEERSG